MILRPVRPASPSGPPMTNLPVGLTCQTVSASIQSSGRAAWTIGEIDLPDVFRGDRVAVPALDMLGRDDDRLDADRLAVMVLDGDLALGVRPELGRVAGLPRLAHHLEDAVGVEDRRRHQLRRLAAGIAEHDALVAGALVLVAGWRRRPGRCRPTGSGGGPRPWPSSSGSRPARSRCRGSPRGPGPRPASSTASGPRTSPAMTTRLVVASVSQATRASGIAPRIGVDDRIGDAVADLVRDGLRRRIRW